MPILEWIGKAAVLNHHREVPYRLLEEHKDLSVGDVSSNLLVQGDNLEASLILSTHLFRRTTWPKR